MKRNIKIQARSALTGVAIGLALAAAAEYERQPPEPIPQYITAETVMNSIPKKHGPTQKEIDKGYHLLKSEKILQEHISNASRDYTDLLVAKQVRKEMECVNASFDLKGQKEVKGKSKEIFPMTQEEIDLLAAICYAEAGNQGDLGKELVAMVVINRVNSPIFPDTVKEVIFQKNQFTTTFDGALSRAWNNVDTSCYNAVERARKGCKYPGILYFTAGGYGEYGTPAFQYKDHYFCTK
jgi:hypothetical protein